MRPSVLLSVLTIGAIALPVAACAQVQVAAEAAWIELDVQGPVPQDDDAMVDALVNQFRPVLVVELSFAKRAAELDEDQMEKLIPKCQATLREFAKQQGGGQHNQFRGNAVFFGGGFHVQQSQQKPEAHLTKQIIMALGEIASDEQLAAYRKELETRQEFRKQATVNQIIAMFDDVLMFTDEQRGKVRESLAEKWRDDWADNVEALQQYGDQYYPVLPSGVIEPHLTESQKSHFSSLQRVSASMGIGTNPFGTAVIDDVKIPAQ